jgi:uncharacterized protein (UPF0332 family)
MTEQERNDIVAYRIGRAIETLKEIHVLNENKLWNTAISRLYYACYYAVSALLLKNSISAQSHSGTRLMFGLHFVKNEIVPKELGKFYSEIFDLRHTSDYDDFVEFYEDDVLSALVSAQKLIQEIDNLL